LRRSSFPAPAAQPAGRPTHLRRMFHQFGTLLAVVTRGTNLVWDRRRRAMVPRAFKCGPRGIRAHFRGSGPTSIDAVQPQKAAGNRNVKVAIAASFISLVLLTLTGCGEEPGTNKNPAPVSAVPAARRVEESKAANVIVARVYWLNTSTGVRHNKSCRWYGKTAGGRRCTRDEGIPCELCGG
jgi:hypothetical protein